MALILQPVTLLLMLKPLDASNPYQHNYEVEEIVSIRASDGKYKMKWKRYDSSQNAFDLKRHICCIGMVQSFHWINNLAPPTLRSLVSTHPAPSPVTPFGSPAPATVFVQLSPIPLRKHPLLGDATPPSRRILNHQVPWLGLTLMLFHPLSRNSAQVASGGPVAFAATAKPELHSVLKRHILRVGGKCGVNKQRFPVAFEKHNDYRIMHRITTPPIPFLGAVQSPTCQRIPWRFLQHGFSSWQGHLS